MNKGESQIASKLISAETMNLSPTAIIELFEIDISDIVYQKGRFTENILNILESPIFRFHNTLKLSNNAIKFGDIEYYAAPIKIEGFEISGKGTLPVPKMSITVNSDGIPFLALLKEKILEIGDLVGAKVTRIRTFLRFLDASNFIDINPPPNLEPNPNAYLVKDIFYIDRKSLETKNTIEYELASILDVEGIQLPFRLLIGDKCNFSYRGGGCMYEYEGNRVDNLHGKLGISKLPIEAAPIATENNEKISDVIKVGIVVKGRYNPATKYNKGDAIFIERKNGIKYYYVAKVNDPPISPPHTSYWIADTCSRTITGCKLRWGSNGSAKVGNSGLKLGELPYGGFPSVLKF